MNMQWLYKLRVKRFNRLLRQLREYQQETTQENAQENGSETMENGDVQWEKVDKLTEDLNDSNWKFPIYTDTTKLLPGFIVYVIGKRPPTAERPYVTYKPEPRVVSSIHDSGVNGGTVFFTYTHQIVRPVSVKKDKTDFQVVSDEDVINSPLTRGHAEYICNLLNLQSKRLYEKQLAKLKQQQQEQ